MGFDSLYYIDEEFKDLSLIEDKFIDKEFVNCTFRYCDFTKTAFDACLFEDCTFEQCELNMIGVADSRFRNCTVLESRALGIDWERVSMPFKINFKYSLLNHCLFWRVDLQQCSFLSCQLQEVLFEQSLLQKVKLIDCDFAGASFKDCDLSGADFSQAQNYNLDLRLNKAKKAIFTMPEAIALLQGLDVVIH